jgi:cell division protein ZapA
MDGGENFLDVRILDREYRVVCPLGEEEALAAAVHLVDGQMREISSKGRNSTPERVAVMAALNFAHEYLMAQAARAEEGAQLETREGNTYLRRKIEIMETRLAALLDMPKGL